MTQSDRLHAAGFAQQLRTDGEIVSIDSNTVAAIINRQPLMWDMQDAGYLAQEPITIEVAKGSAGSLAMAWIAGGRAPADLRGYQPTPRQSTAVIDGIKRKVMEVTNQGDRFLVMTHKLNV